MKQVTSILLDKMMDLLNQYNIPDIKYTRVENIKYFMHGIELRIDGVKPWAQIELTRQDNEKRPFVQNDENTACYCLSIVWPTTYLSRIEEQACISSDPIKIIEAIKEWKQNPILELKNQGKPIDESYIVRLEKIAKARREATSDPSFVQFDEEAISFNDWSQDEIKEITQRIAKGFPRDDSGRLELGGTIILAPYGDPPVNERLRSQWLAALGPVKRRDPQIISIGIHWLIPDNEHHRWDLQQQLWNPKLPKITDGELWGIEGIDCSLIGIDNRDEHIEYLKTEMAQNDSPAIKAMLTILYQDAGRFDEALDIFGIEIHKDIWRAAQYDQDNRDVKNDKLDFLYDCFRSCAPWKIIKNIRLETERLKMWTASKKGRPVKTPNFRINSYPRQAQASKICLMISINDPPNDYEAKFNPQYTADYSRMPDILWKRPIELDLRRFGLE